MFYFKEGRGCRNVAGKLAPSFMDCINALIPNLLKVGECVVNIPTSFIVGFLSVPMVAD